MLLTNIIILSYENSPYISLYIKQEDKSNEITIKYGIIYLELNQFFQNPPLERSFEEFGLP